MILAQDKRLSPACRPATLITVNTDSEYPAQHEDKAYLLRWTLSFPKNVCLMRHCIVIKTNSYHLCLTSQSSNFY